MIGTLFAAPGWLSQSHRFAPFAASVWSLPRQMNCTVPRVSFVIRLHSDVGEPMSCHVFAA
jgi:hypothetical protein